MDLRVQMVITLMRDGLHQKLTLCQMAQRVNLTESHFCRLFKAETGLSPFRYLKVLRMDKAKVLLESTFLNVKEIMNKVGVSDESHFVRDFQIICGRSPVQHRAYVQNGPTSAGLARKKSRVANKSQKPLIDSKISQ